MAKEKKKKDKKETKESKKPKNSQYQLKQRARNKYLARGGTIEEWREGRRNGTITI